MPTKKQLQDATKLLADFDWSRADAMTDEDIVAAASSDPDTSLPSDVEMTEFRLGTRDRDEVPGQAAE